MAIRRRPPGQCSHCGNVYPETDEFFHKHKRRGRTELRAICKNCFSAQTKRYQRGDKYKHYARKKRDKPDYREYMRAAWRKHHAKPEYRKYDRALYRKQVAVPEGREKVRAKGRRRRARINGCTHHHTIRDIRIAMEVQQGRCFYCDVDVSTERTVDHLTPLVRGGSDGPENIVIACASCNFHKADKTYEEFIAQIKHERKRWREQRHAMGGVALLWGRRK